MFSILQVAVLTGVLCSVQSFVIQAPFEIEHSGNTYEDDNFTVSALIERANVNVGEGPDEPLVMYGDIAMPTGFQNADPCTARGCKWPKNRNGKVYVPYRISNQYSRKERNTILQGLRSFAQQTCIRFTPRKRQRRFVDIKSRSGCYSFIGRRNNGQVVSLSRNGCVGKKIIQHELLHALGFNHEQTRSDRDQHVRIQLRNVKRGKKGNFRKIRTRNLSTRYDYNSVMEYGRFAFSKNRKPTIVPIPNTNAVIGRAKQMSPTDILRINRLYACKNRSG